MEKYIVFGILIALFLGFVAKMIFKTKNSYWKGKVLEKIYVLKFFTTI